MDRETAKQIYDQGFEIVYLALKKIDELTEANHQLEIKIKKLEDQLAKDSHNSSKPSSSDGLKKSNQTLCNAHLLRELIFEVEQNNQNWAKRMIKLLLAMKCRVNNNVARR